MATMATMAEAGDYRTLSDYRRPSDYDSRSRDPAGLRYLPQLTRIPLLGWLRLPRVPDRLPPLPLAPAAHAAGLLRSPVPWRLMVPAGAAAAAADPGGPALLILPL